MAWAACSGLNTLDNVLPLVIVQCLCLWQNRNLYPMIPHQQPCQEPQKAFVNRLSNKIMELYDDREPGQGIVSGLPHPLNTGYMFGVKTPGYTGGMRTKAIDRLRNIEDPNGESVHDWFLTNDDNDEVTIAYRPCENLWNNWMETEIKGLYKKCSTQHRS
jgi:hypothetical protein